MGKTLKHTIMKQVIVRLKGDFYNMNTYCSTLKDFLEKRNLKRSDVAEWWKELPIQGDLPCSSSINQITKNNEIETLSRHKK